MLDNWWRRISISMKKGILKKSASRSQPSGRRAQWNEDNLEANEVIKSELNPTKIDDPKTPYHAPLDPVIDMEPLDLEDNAIMTQSLEECGRHKEVTLECRQTAAVPEAVAKGDFSKQRLKHYDMKAARALGKKLTCEEDVEDKNAPSVEGSADGQSEPACVS